MLNKGKLCHEFELEMEYCRQLERKLVAMTKEVTEGKLRCAANKSGIYYYEGKRYLGKNELEFARKLAEQEYCRKLLNAVRTRGMTAGLLKETMESDMPELEEVYAKLHPGRKKLIEPIVCPKDVFIEKWLSEPYEHWEITDENEKGNFITVKGERVRSKSEKIIADMMTEKGIPYRYEYPLPLWNGRKMVKRRPDFFALSLATLEEKVIEHLGMMDSESYMEGAYDKIALYEKNGFFLGEKLLIFHETSRNPLDTEIVSMYLEKYLL